MLRVIKDKGGGRSYTIPKLIAAIVLGKNKELKYISEMTVCKSISMDTPNKGHLGMLCRILHMLLIS